jgi:hypothetical protein
MLTGTPIAEKSLVHRDPNPTEALQLARAVRNFSIYTPDGDPDEYLDILARELFFDQAADEIAHDFTSRLQNYVSLEDSSEIRVFLNRLAHWAQES